MAYTNAVFDPSVPAGASQLSGGDDTIRAAKLDLKERLETFFVDVDDDPLVVQSTILDTIGAKNGKKMLIAGIAFEDATGLGILNDLFYQSNGNPVRDCFFTLTLAPGTVIKTIEALWDKNGNGGCQLDLLSTAFDTGVAQTTPVTLLETAAGIKLTSSGVITVNVLDTTYLVLRARVTGAVGGQALHLYAVRVTYDAATTETL